MYKKLLIYLAAVYLFLFLQGCTVAPYTPTATDLAATRALPAAVPAFDHFIAWVPRNLAATPTVARALAHTRLGVARKQAGDELCDGSWVGNKTITNVIGPISVWAGTQNDGYPAWYYRITHLPGLTGCPAANDVAVYQAMQKKLPDWLTVHAARKDNGAAHIADITTR